MTRRTADRFTLNIAGPRESRRPEIHALTIGLLTDLDILLEGTPISNTARSLSRLLSAFDRNRIRLP